MHATIGAPLLLSAPGSSRTAKLVWGRPCPTPVSCACVAGEVRADGGYPICLIEHIRTDNDNGR